MRKATKADDSIILVEGLQYNPQNSANNKKIAEILLSEQNGFCAYTDEYISRTDAKDVEHFNPTLKGTQADHYFNWFLVKHQWNMEKRNWKDHQPVLHPTANDLEERIIYSEGDYFAKTEDDNEAINLVKLLKLDDPSLAEKRKKYIKRKREDMTVYGQDPETFFRILKNSNACELAYPRAIREEFGIDILRMT